MKAVVLLVLAVAFCGAAFAADPRLMPVRILTDKQWKAEKNVVIVPKGDPRARAPEMNAPAQPLPVAKGADEQWLSPAVELRPILSATPGGVCTPSPANIRQSPSTSAAVVTATTAGERITITAATERPANGYVWVPVTVRGKAGWVAKSLTRACAAPAPQPTQPTTPASSSSRFPLYKQCGMSWSNAQLGSCSGTTVCKAGCAISSVAMILKGRGYDTDPGRLNAWLKANGGYSGCAIYWAKVDKLGKTSCQGFKNGSYSQVCDWVKAGYGVVLNVNNGGHWVLATGCDGKNNIMVNDPGYARSSYAFSAVVRQVLYR